MQRQVIRHIFSVVQNVALARIATAVRLDPEEMLARLKTASEVIAKTGFPPGLDRDELDHAFNAHNNAMKETIPPDRLLVFEVKGDRSPLCDFLGAPVPDVDFPRTNPKSTSAGYLDDLWLSTEA